MEDEARTILRDAVQQKIPDSEAMLKSIRNRFAALGDVDLPQPPRQAMRESPMARTKAPARAASKAPVKKARKRAA